MFVAILNYFLDDSIKILLFQDVRVIEGRFTGFNLEPRYFGRVCSYSSFFLVVFYSQYRTLILKLSIYVSFLGVVLSLSASTYLITGFWFLLLLLFRKEFKYLSLGMVLIIALIDLISTIDFENYQTTFKKIQIVLGDEESLMPGDDKMSYKEPEIFSRFELFDRAALNFLYMNPIYAVLGTGPNLISIPASPYLTPYAYSIYGDRIDSVQHTLIINILARSGILGLLLWSLVSYRVYKSKYSQKNVRICLLMLLLMSVAVLSIQFYIYFVLALAFNNDLDGFKND